MVRRPGSQVEGRGRRHARAVPARVAYARRGRDAAGSTRSGSPTPRHAPRYRPASRRRAYTRPGRGSVRAGGRDLAGRAAAARACCSSFRSPAAHREDGGGPRRRSAATAAWDPRPRLRLARPGVRGVRLRDATTTWSATTASGSACRHGHRRTASAFRRVARSDGWRRPPAGAEPRLPSHRRDHQAAGAADGAPRRSADHRRRELRHWAATQLGSTPGALRWRLRDRRARRTRCSAPSRRSEGLQPVWRGGRERRSPPTTPVHAGHGRTQPCSGCPTAWVMDAWIAKDGGFVVATQTTAEAKRVPRPAASRRRSMWWRQRPGRSSRPRHSRRSPATRLHSPRSPDAEPASPRAMIGVRPGPPSGGLARRVKIHEADAKSLLVAQGLPVPAWEVARTPSAGARRRRQVPRRPGNATGKVVIKAQVLVGGRGKAGGVKLAVHRRRGRGRGRPRSLPSRSRGSRSGGSSSDPPPRS